ncbi:MAG: PolC-type DNA polymerase III [Clostridia bacterium]|nr:PolC-type DNA polymerase III [Clostridia bacterium]
MSSDFRVKIDKVYISEADRKITVHCFYTPREATEADKDAFRRKLAARCGFEALEVVFRLEGEAPADNAAAEDVPADNEAAVEVPADNDTPLPEPPAEDNEYYSAPAPQYDGPEPEADPAPAAAVDSAPAPESIAAPAPETVAAPAAAVAPAPAPEAPSAPAHMPETVAVDFSEAEYLKEQEELIRADSRSNRGYYTRGGEDGGSSDFPRAPGPGAGFYNGRGDGRRNKRTRIAPPEGEEPKKDADGNVILIGKDFDAPIVRMIDLSADSGYVALRGRVFAYESKKLSSGSYIAIISITDDTYSVVAKFFFQPEDLKYVEGFFDKNKYIRLYGEAQLDKFSHELTIMARAIIASKQQFRVDNAPVKRVELHLHTLMSAVDAITRPEELMETLSRWGWDACAITDHGVVQGYSELTQIYKKKYKKTTMPDFKFIYGCEVYLCHQTPDMSEAEARKLPTYHCIVLVKDEVGLKNLYELISRSNLDYYHKRPRMPKFEIDAHREGLLISTACSLGEFYDAIINGESDARLEEIASWYDYLEIQPSGNNMYLVREGTVDSLEDVQRFNLKVIEIADRLGKPVVATCDVHYLNPDDEIYRAVLQAGQGFDDYMFQAPVYLRTTEEMLKEFEYLGDRAQEIVVDNTRLIASQIKKIQPVPDGFYPPSIPGSDETLRTSAYEKARSIYGDPLPELVEKRLERELSSIIGHGYSIMYITAKELVAESARNGYQVGSRGSVGSSLAAYMAGITEVNSLPAHYRCPNCRFLEFHENEGYDCGFDMPKKNCPNCGTELIRDGYDIPFETFLGFEGDKVPDIDLNFASDDQPNAHKYTEVLFGKGKVFRAGTVTGLAEKNARGYVLKYLERSGKTASNAEINRLASGFVGVKKTTGQHPGGIIVIPRDKEVTDFTPVQHPAEKADSDTVTTHFEFKYLHDTILKLDILGHEGPEMLKLLENYTGVDSRGVDINDENMLTIFSSPDALKMDMSKVKISMPLGTYGIPELGTNFVIKMLQETRPKKVSELVRISGLSHGTDVWAGNVQTLIQSHTCTLSEAICCRDDIMLYLIGKGLDKKMSFTIMESVRKGKGLTPEWEAEMRAHEVPEWYIGSCKKIKYMFPKAHAVAYVILSLRIAWFKVYRPDAYYAARFSLKIDDFDGANMLHGPDKMYARMAAMNLLEDGAQLNDGSDAEDAADNMLPDESFAADNADDSDAGSGEVTEKDKSQASIYFLLAELYARGLKFLPVDIYESEARNFVPTPEGIRPPIACLQGIGASAAESIAAESRRRKALGTKYISIDDFQASTGANKAVTEVLRAEGCLEGLPESNQMSLFDMF